MTSKKNDRVAKIPKPPRLTGKYFYSQYDVASFQPHDCDKTKTVRYESYLTIVKQQNGLIWGKEWYRPVFVTVAQEQPDLKIPCETLEKEKEAKVSWKEACFTGHWRGMFAFESLYLAEEKAFFEGTYDEKSKSFLLNFVGADGSSFQAYFEKLSSDKVSQLVLIR